MDVKLDMAKVASEAEEIAENIPLYKTSSEAARFDASFEQTSHMVGEGGFGKVSLGISKVDGSRVAIKRLDRGEIPLWYKCDDGKVIPLEVEMMKKAADIPQIINLIDSFDMGDEYWLIIQYIPGSMDLEQYITQSEPLAEATSAQFFNQLCTGVMALYKIGIIHRDIKASNIIVTPSLEIKIIDFGCSDFLRDRPYAHLSCTPLYCPPEYINDDLYLAEPAAVWSLGMVLVQLLLGVELTFMEEDDDDVSDCSGDDEQEEEDDCAMIGRSCCLEGSVDALLKGPSVGVSTSAMNLLESCLKIDLDKRILLGDIIKHPWLASQ